MKDKDMKQHACEFARWLWYNVSEDRMSQHTWEQLYEEFNKSTQTEE